MRNMTKFRAIGTMAGILFTCLFIFALFYFQNTESSANGPVMTESDGYQIATFQVKDDGFYPANIEVKAGVPTKLNFKKPSGFTCIRSVASRDIGLDLYLEKGDNFTTLQDLKPGTYKLHCGMYMYYVTITVK
ncbi:cupredoxin domain-containing protein [Paenibacillus sp. HWE-109]|uniref:cupredoxin domain-containing protein n=1 Tax=Paenibacillus sp. HWE-109 TaxID=1306526 RepID=UPI001EDDDC17|nr:cupredoxin domain-containing protein [Paenibacillus sp. HWE-109]UKS29361.1 cupredoxin domain-containing protein [Paenibacillus sp. HWE-109]